MFIYHNSYKGNVCAEGKKSVQTFPFTSLCRENDRFVLISHLSHRSFVLHPYPLEILPFVKNKLNSLHLRQHLNIGSNHIVQVQKAWQEKLRYVFIYMYKG